MPPQLLVSVRNGDEAAAAIQGGCDILDIKEPSRGSLGMADVAALVDVLDTVRTVLDTVRTKQNETIVSAALGEITDWRESPPPKLPTGITYAKLGTAGLLNDLHWRRTWNTVRLRFEETAGYEISWIAVAYADWQQANSPSPPEIIAAAAEAGCEGVLFDTCTKSGRGLFEWLSEPQLCALANDIHAAGQLVAFAGQITADDMPALMTIAPDIIAIRSAACVQGKRTNAVTAEAVRQFKSTMSGTAIST